MVKSVAISIRLLSSQSYQLLFGMRHIYYGWQFIAYRVYAIARVILLSMTARSSEPKVQRMSAADILHMRRVGDADALVCAAQSVRQANAQTSRVHASNPEIL